MVAFKFASVLMLLAVSPVFASVQPEAHLDRVSRNVDSALGERALARAQGAVLARTRRDLRKSLAIEGQKKRSNKNEQRALTSEAVHAASDLQKRAGTLATTTCYRDRGCRALAKANAGGFDDPNGTYQCDRDSRRCVVGCIPKFVPVNGVCTRQSVDCAKTNGQVPNGAWIASTDGTTCILACNTALNYVLDPTGTQCINIKIDPSYCGSEGIQCPTSYNGNGRATCVSGVCGLACVGGTRNLLTTPGGIQYCK